MDSVAIWTDGACSGNPGPCGIGIIIRNAAKEQKISKFLGYGTNIIAELTAVAEALEAISRSESIVKLYTDSNHVMGLFGGWKMKAHLQLVNKIRQLARECHSFTPIKVEAHASNKMNNLCDKLARKAVKTRKDDIEEEQL